MDLFFRIQLWLAQFEVIFLLIPSAAKSAVMPPPWANPKINPCATQPRGWQLLYWPPDGKCYKIFQLGYPCPDGMELSPAPSRRSEEQLSAECRCPPSTAQSARDGRCYELFTIGPCEKGSYFAPDTNFNKNNSSKRQWGVCKQTKMCPNPTHVYYPKNGQCYQRMTRGPCPKGQLMIVNNSDKIPMCKCNKQKEFNDYRYENGQCYQHFTRGPCTEKGQLFLPDRTCGCYSFLPHFHEDSEQCFEIGTIGPCALGEVFQLENKTNRGACSCKSGYIRYQNSTSCYRPFTQGPCPSNHFLVNTTHCIQQTCPKGHLYHPVDKTCYRIGTRGPCPKGRIVTFDFAARPSVDGISYNAVCMCQRNDCQSEVTDIRCNKTNGLVKYRKQCYKLYTQEPCPKGAWLVPMRQPKDEMWSEGDKERKGICECLPGYSKTVRPLGERNVTMCMSPTVILADFLNKNYSSSVQIEPS